MAKTFLTKKNNAKSTITDNPLTSGATTVNVQSGDGAKFPVAPFHATLYTSDPSVGAKQPNRTLGDRQAL